MFRLIPVLLVLLSTDLFAAKKPNFVFFLVDDMGWTDPRGFGNTFHETPNMDRLMREGMKFTNAYAACPVCSPTRASIISGKYPATVGVTDFIPGHWRPWAKLETPQTGLFLDTRHKSFATALKSGGYSTGAFGKWHLNWGKNGQPDQHGFDEAVITGGRHFAPRFRANVFGREQPKPKPGQYLGDYLTDLSVDFISRQKENPFCLYLSHYAVHIPLEAKSDLIRKYSLKKNRPKNRVNHPVYAAMVEHVDQSLGKVLAALKKHGVEDNTVVIFFSDNGGLYRRFDGKGEVVMKNTPLRDEKGSLYEGGIRVPCIIRWPGKVKAGSKSAEPISSIDFLPTMCAIAGVKPPACDGVSLMPILQGKKSTLSRDAIFWHYPHYHHTSPGGAIRAGDWKLIEFYAAGGKTDRIELYHLKNDLSETTNLAKKHPEIAEKLLARLKAWRKSAGAVMPKANAKFDASREHLWQRRQIRRPRRD